MDEITSPQVARITGLTYRQVDYLWRRGLIGDGSRPGSGIPRRWALVDLLRAAAYAAVTDLVGPLEVEIARDLLDVDVERDALAVLAAGAVAITVDLAELRRTVFTALSARGLHTADEADRDEAAAALSRLAG